MENELIDLNWKVIITVLINVSSDITFLNIMLQINYSFMHVHLHNYFPFFYTHSYIGTYLVNVQNRSLTTGDINSQKLYNRIFHSPYLTWHTATMTTVHVINTICELESCRIRFSEPTRKEFRISPSSSHNWMICSHVMHTSL